MTTMIAIDSGNRVEKPMQMTLVASKIELTNTIRPAWRTIGTVMASARSPPTAMALRRYRRRPGDMSTS
jgi:hypothetical protein